jgi:hypothetical protein
MSHQSPPRWAEFLLKRLLSARDRETVTGDLHEDYAEFLVPRFGRRRANLWYLHQISSIATRCIREGGTVTKLLFLTSAVTLLCGCWLAFMECLLRHPGFQTRAAVALLIAAAGLATLLVRLLHLGVRNERWLWAAAAALIGLGVFSFLRNARAAHFEGFVFVIAIVIVLQGLLMLVNLGRRSHPGRTVAGT